MTIAAGNLSAKIITYGAIIQDLRLAGHDAPLTLGFERFQDYLDHINYFGAVAGSPCQPHPRGPLQHRRHSPTRSSRTILNATVCMAARAAMRGATGRSRIRRGFRHAVTGRCRRHDGISRHARGHAARTAFRARNACPSSSRQPTDQPTLCNLAQHAYFNLDDGGSTSTSAHYLQIDADAYLPVDERLIPIGEIRPVPGTAFDFRTPREINASAEPYPYDHNFCLDRERRALTRAAWAKGARSGVEMEVWTTEPGLQFYAGHYIMTRRRRVGWPAL